MKKNLFALIALFLSITAFPQSAVVKHVVLVTIDGFRPDFYLDTPWQTPHLRELVKGGFHAKGVNSVFPSMTYPSHTTIITGVQPVKHGVYYNNRYDATRMADQNYWQDSSIHVPTIVHAVHDRGLKVASIYWPVSAGSPADYNIPDIGGRGEAELDANTRPAGFRQQVTEALATAGGVRGDQGEASIAAYIIKKDPPALMTLHLFGVDHTEHQQGRTGVEVMEAVRNADSAVGIIVAALKEKGIWDSTILIVTGDHGFVTVTTYVNPNALLKAAGLMNDVKQNDWKAQFYYSGGSAYLYLKDPKDKSTLQAVQKILADQPDSIKRYYRVIDRKKMDAIGGNPEVAFALSAENGAAFGGKDSDIIKPGHGGTHGYFPDFFEIRTGFIIYGPGINAGGSVQLMNLRDIAPIVMSILRIPFPSAAGKAPAGIFK